LTADAETPPRDRLVDLAFKVAWAVTRRTPEHAATRVLETAADRIWRQRGTGVVRLEANLRRAAPHVGDAELRELSRQALRSYFRYWHEAFRLSAIPPARVVDGVVTAGEPALREAFGRGSGAVIALPHMANWDLAGAWACLTGMPVSTVAERLRPESLYTRFVRYRERLGMEVLALNGGDSPFSALRSALRRGRLVCLLADRDLSGSGVEVKLLDEPARLAAGPAALARMTGAPLFAATLSYRGPLLHIAFSPQVVARTGRAGLTEMTQDLADWFSRGIRQTPQDWHMLQRVFTADVGEAE
jgi:KDO2-lipid IV(A) lauroyltransferase